MLCLAAPLLCVRACARLVVERAVGWGIERRGASRAPAELAVPVDALQRGGMAHVEIAVSSNVVTLVNLFTVMPENQEQVVRALTRATDDVMKSQPGFVSASIHKSLDGRKVANYAQWRSREDFEAMLQNPAAKQHMAEIASLVERFEPTLYTVASVHSAAE